VGAGATLLGAVDALLGSSGLSLWPADRLDYDRNLTTARARLDEASFEAAWAAGRAMSMEEAIAYALEDL
jgi:hypothetical protein